MQNSSFRLTDAWWFRYGTAVASVGLAALARFSVDRLWGNSSPYIFFYAAIMLAVVFGGRGPAAVATVLGGVIGATLFVPPHEHFAFAHPAEILRLGVFLTIGLFMSLLGGGMHAERLRLRAEQAMRDNEQRYRCFVEASSQVVWSTNPWGEVEMDIPAWQAFTGQTAEQAKGFGWMDAIHADDRQRVAEAWSRAFEEGAIYEVEYRLRIADGQWRDILARGVPVRNADGKIREYIGTCIDVTRRKQAERAMQAGLRRVELLATTAGELLQAREPQKVVESLCRQVMEHLDCHAFFNFLVDREAGRLHLNACAGIPEEEARRIEWLDYGTAVCGCAARDGCRIVAEHIPSTPDPRTELVKSYGIRAYACHPLLGPGGEVLGTLSFGTRSRETFDEADLSLMKAVAGHVAVAMARMQAGQALAAAKLAADQARETAEAANQAKDHFLAVLSHELRTPLSPVLLSAAILENDRSFPDQYRDDISTIRRNAELEARLIDDLLDITRIARSKLQLAMQSVRLGDVLARAAETCEPDAVDKGQLLKIDMRSAAEATVRGDPARLQQVFWNVIKNAIKFTPSGGVISVRCATRTAGDQSWASVVISDNGVGIPAERLPNIFNAFEQGGADITRRYGGLGLGLAICRSLVEMHGGIIRAASEGEDKGAAFTIELPLESPVPAAIDEPGAPADAQSATPASGPAILLVEDHEPTARATARLLRGFGYEVRIAPTMAAALAEAHKPFDVLVSDLGLPDGTGYDLLRQLVCTRPVKAIALSGYGMNADISRSRDAGFLEHLVKPINVRTLQEAIERACNTPPRCDPAAPTPPAESPQQL